jgi:hypothetical protein
MIVLLDFFVVVWRNPEVLEGDRRTEIARR